MAAPVRGAASPNSSDEDDERDEQTQDPEEFDFCSPKFNPLKALFSPDVKVPFENVKSFSSVASYEKAINVKRERSKPSPSTSTDSRNIATECSEGSSQADSSNTVTNTGYSKTHRKEGKIHEGQRRQRLQDIQENADRNKATKLPSQPSRKHHHRRNVLTRMENMSGPLELLTRCVMERLHVRVMTRAAVTVRSICRGYIVAFDKTFNLALIDCDEIYRRPACLGKIRARRTHKLQSAQKTLKMEREEQNEKFMSGEGISAISLTETITPLTQESEDSGRGSQVLEMKEERETKEDTMKENKIEISAEEKQKSTSDSISVAMKRDRFKKSIHEDTPFPHSFYEREALMLGIPDENVEHRHVNQLFLRGENIVLISVIDE